MTSRSASGGWSTRRRAGRSGALLVRGETGVGKTALLEESLALATRMRVIALAGVESEVEVPAAGLEALCRPLLGHLDDLPREQAARARRRAWVP